MCRFLRMIYCNRTTQVEFAGKYRRSGRVFPRAASFLKWRSIPSFVGCIARSSQEILPFLIFFCLLRVLVLMILRSLLHLFGTTDRFGSYLSNNGPNSWAQSELSEMLLGAKKVLKDVSLSCVGCQITVRMFARCTLSSMPSTQGTTIGPDGHIHQLDGTPEKFIHCVLKINVSAQSFVDRLCDFKIYAISVLSYIGSVCAPDKATLKAEGPCPSVYDCWTVQCFSHQLTWRWFRVALVLTWLVPTLSASRPAIELPRVRTRSTKDLTRSWLPGCMTSLPSSHSAAPGKRNSLLPPWLVAPRMRSTLCVVWTAMANLMRYHRTRSRSLPKAYSATNYIHRILHDQSPYGPPMCWDRSAVIELRTSCTTCVACFSSWARCWFSANPLQGLCTAQRFHFEGDEQTCRVGCPDEPDSLSHYNERLFCMVF